MRADRVDGETPAAVRAGAEWIGSRERGSRLLLRVMTFISLRLGRPAGRVVLYGIAIYFFLFAPAARRAMRNYLRRALGRAPSPADRFRLILNFATTIHDRVYLLNERYDLFDIRIEGRDVIERHCVRGGVFLMGAHMGSFEVTRALGLTRPGGMHVAMAMYPDNARKINAMLAAINPRLKADIIPLGTIDSMLQIHARLEAGACVGLLGDRTIGVEQLQPVAFLGTPAAFPTSPMKAAAMLRRPVIFMIGLYRGGNRYHVIFEELADFGSVAARERSAAVARAIERYAAMLEHYCRSDPYNWFNFFDFWQQQPTPPGERA
jgi:predicted LPLAT superfamily acyltransferase